MAVSISIGITQNSQSITNNKSNVTVKVTAKWTGGSNNRTGECHGYITIDGTKYNFTGLTFNDSVTTSGSKVVMTKKVDVTHAADGTKTLNCSASFSTYVSSGTVTASASKVLTTIPRKSSLSVANGTLGTEQTLTVTRQATSFTHSIKAVCGSHTVYIKADGSTSTAEVKHSDCSIPFTPPLSWADANTTGTSVSVTYTIVTYSGSTNVGSNSYTKTCTIPGNVKPSCTVSAVESTSYSSEWGGLVQGYSKLKVTVTPTLAYGSPIASYKTTANGTTYTSASFTTGALSSSGTLTIAATVTDKRGRSGSATTTVSVLEYAPPVISKLTVHRCDEDGVENDNGEYILITFSYSVSTLNSQNYCWSYVEYKKSSDDSYSEPVETLLDDVYTVADRDIVIPADSGSSYDIRFSVVDGLNTVSKATSASTAYTIQHWKADGTGMGIGKISELSGVLDIGMQTRHMGGILQPVLENNTDFDAVMIPNTYTLKITNDAGYTNCPLLSGTGTLKVESCGEEGQLHQIVSVCHKTNPLVYERFYYGSAWGEWVCTSDYDGVLLWQGGRYMSADHTNNLSEPVSKQRNGIILVFSEYIDDAVSDTAFHCRFVPKMQVSLHPGRGYCFQLSTSNLAYFATKYLYISDDKIVGHANNTLENTGGCGITYTNKRFVLRYVIGV